MIQLPQINLDVPWRTLKCQSMSQAKSGSEVYNEVGTLNYYQNMFIICPIIQMGIDTLKAQLLLNSIAFPKHPELREQFLVIF